MSGKLWASLYLLVAFPILGFVLVRGADDVIKRHASAVKPGNELTLTFADGEVKATGVGAPVIRPPRRGIFKLKGQGDLF